MKRRLTIAKRRLVPLGEGSVRVKDQKRIDGFVADPDNPFLVSFPRTGSHWLRMVMELYFERPTLVRSFYYTDRNDFLLYHTHDLHLDLQRRNAIYLFRDPVDTIYSQIVYERESVTDETRIQHWSTLYGRHLDKWLSQERFTVRKTIVRYEALREQPPAAFAPLCAHFEKDFDEQRLHRALKQVDKREVKRKTGHDPQVVQLSSGYNDLRADFRHRYEALVWETVNEKRAHLSTLLQGKDT